MQQAQPSLLDLRRARALTIRQMGVDQAAYVQFEHGRRLPSARSLRKLATVFNLSIEEVLNAAKQSVAQAEASGAHAIHPTEGGAA